MSQERPVLSETQMAEFHRNGVLTLRSFYDTRKITDIQLAIHNIIGQIMKRHGLKDERRAFSPRNFDDGYQELIARNRSFGGEVYDAVKQIPAFIRLLGDPRHEQVFGLLRSGAIPGIASGGYGLRIDNPNEEHYRAAWHQEYPSQLRSVDGIVFWSPLLDITAALGPVQFCLGSHCEGPFRVFTEESDLKTGAYAVRLKDEAGLIARYEKAAPLTSPGDLVIIDFLTLHASGYNTSPRSRWSLQFRYFNFNDPTGMAHGWKGSFSAGVDFKKIHPELCID